MAKYYANKIVDLFPSVKNAKGIYEEIMNVSSFELPEMEFGEGEISGSGIIGTVNVPDFTGIESMEAKITGKSYESMNPIFNPLGVSLKLNWAVDKVGADGAKAFDSYTAYINGFPKNIPGGEKTKGETQELEATISTTYYKLIQNGKTITEYNPLAGKLVINGVDVMAKINQAVGR